MQSKPLGHVAPHLQTLPPPPPSMEDSQSEPQLGKHLHTPTKPIQVSIYGKKKEN